VGFGWLRDRLVDCVFLALGRASACVGMDE
jgi:hypothetical protein